MALVAVLAYASLSISWAANSADLLALWAAGLAHAQGAGHLIYPDPTGPFTMRPQEGWVPMMVAEGYVGELYAFIYPPLWAVLAGWLTTVADMETVVDVARVVNHALLLATFWLAWRLAQRPLPLAGWMLAATALCMVSLPGMVGLRENQAQILVGFLIVLAIERERAGAQVAAGIALALAASIKLYPAAFALVWLAMLRWRAVAAFALAGGGLALASVALAGWPLHARFLETLAQVSATSTITALNYGLEPLLALLVPAEAWIGVSRLDILPDPDGPSPMHQVALRPGWRAPLAFAAMLGTLAAMAIALRRAGPGPRGCAIWALGLTVVTFLLPLPWTYSYLAPLAFLPALLVWLGPRLGGVLTLGVAVPLSMPFALGVMKGLDTVLWILSGSAACLLLGAGYLAAAVRLAHRPRRVGAGDGPGPVASVGTVPERRHVAVN